MTDTQRDPPTNLLAPGLFEGQTAFEAKPLQMFQVSGRSDVVGRTKWRRWEGTLRVE